MSADVNTAETDAQEESKDGGQPRRSLWSTVARWLQPLVLPTLAPYIAMRGAGRAVRNAMRFGR